MAGVAFSQVAFAVRGSKKLGFQRGFATELFQESRKVRKHMLEPITNPGLKVSHSNKYRFFQKSP